MRGIPFHVLVADIPWRFRDKMPSYGAKKLGRGASAHYSTMSVEEACLFPIPRMADDSILLLWRVAAMQEEALKVCRAWGFVPKSEIVWRKLTRKGGLHFGQGHYTRGAHETCLIATRGSGPSVVKLRNIRSTFDAPVGRHSEKPGSFFDLVERWLVGPYAELFARRRRPGWATFGLEVDGPVRGRLTRMAA